MAVLHALRRTLPALRRNPILFVPMLLLMAVQLPSILAQSVDPILSSIVSMGVSLLYLVFAPFFQGGMIAMADEAIDDHTTLQTFIAGGKTHYVSILIAYLLLLAVYFVLGIIGFFLGIAGFATVLGSGGLESANLAVLIIILAFIALLVLVYFVAIFFLQFYGQAIVIDDKGAIGGLKHSASVVRSHLVSTFGYSLLCSLVGLLFGGVFATASIILAPQPTTVPTLPDPSLGVTALLALLLTTIGTAFGAFFLVYSVAFYRTITN